MRISCLRCTALLATTIGGRALVESFQHCQPPRDASGRRHSPTARSSTSPTTMRMRPPSGEGGDDASTTTTRRDAMVSLRDALLASSSAGVASLSAWRTSPNAAFAATSTPEETPQQLKSEAVGAEIALSGLSLFGLLYVLSGRSYPTNDDFSAAKAKVVMIEAEPYGLSVGRRYYDGVNVRANDPIPASDRVKSSCERGVIDDGCAAAISDFLGEVREISDAGGDAGPSVDQRETADAVLTYLDSLSPSSSSSLLGPGRGVVVGGGEGGEGTSSDAPVAVAFASYLDGLSRGEIDAPSSPRVVAEYLSSLNDVRGRMDALETSVGRLPDEISSRLEHLQRERDEQLAMEFVKIRQFLIESGASSGAENRVPSVDMDGNYEPVNGSYRSRGFS